MTNLKNDNSIKCLSEENIDNNNLGKRVNISRYCGNASCYTNQDNRNKTSEWVVKFKKRYVIKMILKTMIILKKVKSNDVLVLCEKVFYLIFVHMK